MRKFSPLLLACVLLAATIAAAQTSPYSPWPAGPSTDPNFFPLAVWLQSPGHAQEFKNIGINTFVAHWGDLDQTGLSQLATAQMPLIVEQNSVGLTSAQRTDITGWTQIDEPDNAQPDGNGGYGACIPASTVVASYSTIRAQDTTRPIFLNFGRGVADTQWGGRGPCTGQTSYYPAAIPGGDILAFDIYPVSDYNGKLELVAQGVNNLKTWIGSNQNKVIWNFIEASPFRGGTVPTPAQIKAEVWMSLIHGSQGIVYFVHQFEPTSREDGIFNYPTIVQGVTDINAQIKTLAPVLNSATVPNGVQSSFSAGSVPLSTMVKKVGGTTYVFAVTERNTSGTATFSGLSGLSGQVTVIGENRQIAMNNGQFQDSFSGYGVHLYQIGGATTSAPEPPTGLKAVVN